MDVLISKTLQGYNCESTLLWDCDYAWVVSKLIRSARQGVYLTTYKMEPKSTPKAQNINRLISQLVSADHRGLDVKVLMNFQENKKATSSINWYAANALARRNLKSRHLSSGRILHAKIVIIDFDIVIIGSHNWSVLSQCRNMEFSVMLRSKVINRELREKFLYLWSNSTEFPTRKT